MQWEETLPVRFLDFEGFDTTAQSEMEESRTELVNELPRLSYTISNVIGNISLQLYLSDLQSQFMLISILHPMLQYPE
jgi:hypothetical protein